MYLVLPVINYNHQCTWWQWHYSNLQANISKYCCVFI